MVPTRDHAVIRQWAAEESATPAQIDPRKFDGEPAVLTFLIQGIVEVDRVEPISWEMFFALFDLLELSFAYENQSPYFDIIRIKKQQQAGELLH